MEKSSGSSEMTEWLGDKEKGDLNPRHQDAMTNAAVTVV